MDMSVTSCQTAEDYMSHGGLYCCKVLDPRPDDV